MRSSLSGAAVCLALGIFAQDAHAQFEADDPPSIKYEIKGKREILLNGRFQSPRASDKSAAALVMARGDGYGSISYSIGTHRQKEAIRQVIQGLALALPAKFGNSTGTYVINITVTNSDDGKMLAKEPILSFQWTRERQLLFFEKTVGEVQKTSWNGTLVDRMLVTKANPRLKVAVEVSLQKDRSLDFEFIKKAAKAYGASTIAAAYPLPTAALPMIESITGLLNDLYARSEKKSLVEEEEITVAPGAPVVRADIVFTDDNQQRFVVPVIISIAAQPSVIAPALKFPDPKFDKAKLEGGMFLTERVKLADGKTAVIADLIPESSKARYRNVGPMLDTLKAGDSYARDDTAIRCSDLYGALNEYLSKYDARAMFWSFVQEFGDRMSKDACVGVRRAELEAVGLTF
jgi:hypothetical protein